MARFAWQTILDALPSPPSFLGVYPRVQDVQQLADRTIANVERVIVGKPHAVRLTMVALLCNGHVLIEDVPGVGKTVLAKSFARSIGASFKRIQFTPDLLPSDITGVEIYNQQSRTFEFRPGPLMSHFVLADEINRATPKTQSALLESMEEGQITIDGESHTLPRPFVVLATQNPIDFEGTFPLPEAQLDRFLLTISLGYPRTEDEIAILGGQQHAHPLEALTPVTQVDELIDAQVRVREVYVDDLVRRYIVTLVQQTRQHPELKLGSSPRGSLALFHCAQAWAATFGRDFVTPDDVKAVAIAVLSHRLISRAWTEDDSASMRLIVSNILASTPVPGNYAQRTPDLPREVEIRR
ncbi:MAG: ATPase associated with various cellular 3 [Chloroflexi bacterium]|nr:ATPase associated with various cellular 3 [Chloroflexota bacterium]